ncbi:MAG TPA: alcohol dehydrogenase catalytic domain-containing protein [Dehalococcoidia bacterium]|nr:alcohol dehydrogenase catalytic domain-containing protein [Dehalococcoidia bacterium]
MARDMRAAFCTGKQTIEVRDAEVPKPGPGEALVRVRACGICGTDLHFYGGQLPSMATVSPGHEFCGEVAEVGEGVTGFAAGDRVVVEPIRSCRECSYCRTGQYQICPKHVLLGTFIPGGLAEYVCVPAYTLYALPDGLDWELGALAEPLAVAVHGLHIAELAMGERVLVMGSGAIGVLSVLAGKVAGAGEVIATYRHEHQGQAALAAGADRIVKDGETAGLEKDGIDVVVETVGGAAPTLSQALGIVRPGGRIAVLGLFTQPVQMNALGLMLKEVKMAGGLTYCRPGQHSDFDTALSILHSHPDKARAIISHRFPLAEASQAFATAADKSTGAIKVQVSP